MVCNTFVFSVTEINKLKFLLLCLLCPATMDISMLFVRNTYII